MSYLALRVTRAGPGSLETSTENALQMKESVAWTTSTHREIISEG